MATHRYPKTRTYDPGDPQYLFGDWAVKSHTFSSISVRERSIWDKDVEDPIAVEVEATFPDGEVQRLCRLTVAALKARTAKVRQLPVESPSGAQTDAQSLSGAIPLNGEEANG